MKPIQYKTIPFIPRCKELLAIEGNYDGVVLSCRHRDILRCSTTRHFSSCFNPNGGYNIMPIAYCYRPEVCIVFRRDKSGQFIGRVFGFFDKESNTLKLTKVYGNGLSIDDVRKNVNAQHPELRIVETHGDVYFPVH